MKSLGLWANGTFLGTWTRRPHQADTLQYDVEWVSSKDSWPLSLTLPFASGTLLHQGATVRNYFENLLPDSLEIRSRLGRRYGVSATEGFDLLAEAGRDCAGALQILPPGVRPAPREAINAIPLTEAEVANVLRAACASTPEYDGRSEHDCRIALAGAQEKTALLHFNGRWHIPLGSTPTTHIFKLPMGLVGNMRADMSSSVENEWLCSLIFEAFGLSVAKCWPMQFEDMKALVVERFDRRWSTDAADQLIRVPQEDLCQATGLPPDKKYENDGGPGMDRIMSLLDGSLNPQANKLTFFQSQVLFWLLCATDGHAKNFSIHLHPTGVYELTPMYDILSAYPLLGHGPNKISPFRARMAMGIRSKNTHWKMRDILRRHWLSFGERHGVVASEGHGTASVVDDLIDRTPAVVRRVRAMLPSDFPSALAESIFSGLQAAADRLSK
jgi:serine/threonine-protein kinase HipA